MGYQLGFISFAAHSRQETAHLGKRCAAGALDVSQRVTVLSELVRKLVPDRTDLEHHHADRVSDDVMELTRDPRTLLRHRDARSRIPLPLGQGRALFRRLGLLGAFAQSKPGQPADRELEGNEDEIGGYMSRDLVDDDRRAAENERQPMPACRAFRTLPSRNATAIPTTNRLVMNGISRQSTKEIPAASSQYDAGAANGKRRRAKIASTNDATAATTNQTDEWGALGAPRLTAKSSRPRIARSAIPSSNQYLRARCRTRLTY